VQSGEKPESLQQTAGRVYISTLTVSNPFGLHARPADWFVKTAISFSEVDIQEKNLTPGRGPVHAKSINYLTSLDVQ
jgi:phosphotransferase system HPr-like phosphotransfer protein